MSGSLRAYWGAVIAIGFLSAMDAAMKLVSLDYGAFAALTWRTALAAPLLAIPYFLLRKAAPSQAALRLHLVRGVLMVPMSFTFFWGLTYIPMAQAIAIAFIAPLIALVLAALVLKERVGPRLWAGSLLAFGGVTTILFGQSRADMGDEALLGGLAIMASALLYAVNMIVMRRQSQAARPLEVTFFYFAISGVGFWLVALVVGVPDFPTRELGAFLIATALSICGMIGLAWAYARAEAAFLSTSEYAGFLWASLFGWLVFREVPSPWTMAGAVLIVAGSVIATRAAPTPVPTDLAP